MNGVCLRKSISPTQMGIIKRLLVDLAQNKKVMGTTESVLVAVVGVVVVVVVIVVVVVVLTMKRWH